MKLPRFFTRPVPLALALGCALLAFAPLHSAQAQMKIIPLDSAGFDKMSKFVATVNADPAKKAAIDEAGKDQEIATAMMTGGSINDAVNTKYPKAAAAYKSGGFTPEEFNISMMSLVMASTGLTDGTSDAAVAKKNIDFYNANKEKIDKLMSTMQ